MKRKLVFITIISLLFIITIYLSYVFLKNKETEIVINDKYKISTKEIEGPIEESKLITFFYENKIFLELGIASNKNKYNLEIDYEKETNRSKLIWAYLITHPDINKSDNKEEIYTYTIKEIDDVSTRIFGSKTNVNNLDNNLFNIKDNKISLTVPTSVNQSLPVYYKTEIITEDVYNIYYVNFKNNIDSNLTEKYINNESKVETIDLTTYNPPLITLTIKKKNNKYYLLKSSYIEDYNYE